MLNQSFRGKKYQKADVHGFPIVELVPFDINRAWPYCCPAQTLQLTPNNFHDKLYKNNDNLQDVQCKTNPKKKKQD